MVGAGVLHVHHLLLDLPGLTHRTVPEAFLHLQSEHAYSLQHDTQRCIATASLERMVGSNAFAVLRVLWNIRNENDEAHPTIAGIGRMTGLAYHTVESAIARLKLCGLVERYVSSTSGKPIRRNWIVPVNPDDYADNTFVMLGVFVMRIHGDATQIPGFVLIDEITEATLNALPARGGARKGAGRPRKATGEVTLMSSEPEDNGSAHCTTSSIIKSGATIEPTIEQSIEKSICNPVSNTLTSTSVYSHASHVNVARRDVSANVSSTTPRNTREASPPAPRKTLEDYFDPKVIAARNRVLRGTGTPRNFGEAPPRDDLGIPRQPLGAWLLTARTPAPPRILVDNPPEVRARILANAYRGYLEHETGVTSFAFRRGDITATKHYYALVNAAEALRIHDIAPIAWVRFSWDVWVKCARKASGISTPPIAWMFSLKRISEAGAEGGWFETSHYSSETQPRTVFGPAHKEAHKRWTLMQFALLRIRADKILRLRPQDMLRYKTLVLNRRRRQPILRREQQE